MNTVGKAEVDYDHQHGAIVRVTVGSTTVAVFLHDETGIVSTPDGQAGIEVHGPWHKVRQFLTQAEQPEAGRDELLPCAWCGSPAESIGMAGIPEPYADREMFTCSNEECMVGEASFSRNQWNRRDHPPTNAEAVRLLREVTTHMGYIIETLSPGDGPPEPRSQWDYDAIQLEREVEQFLAQHGGRGDA